LKDTWEEDEEPHCKWTYEEFMAFQVDCLNKYTAKRLRMLMYHVEEIIDGNYKLTDTDCMAVWQIDSILFIPEEGLTFTHS